MLLTGPPRCGKTTLARTVALALCEEHRLSGFYTEEVMGGGDRVGFDIVTLDGQQSQLARKGAPGGPRVGAYTVFLGPLEGLAVGAMRDDEAQAFVVDEIGLMELKSARFKDEVLRLLSDPRPVLATIRWRNEPFCDRVKARPDVEVVQVTEGNRDVLAQELATRLAGAMGGH